MNYYWMNPHAWRIHPGYAVKRYLYILRGQHSQGWLHRVIMP
jgi:hypothetical protein